MKKKILFIILLIILVSNIYSKKNKELLTDDYDPALDAINDTALQKTFNVEADKDIIYEKIQQWIKDNFSGSKDYIIEENKTEYYITGIGDLILTYKDKNNTVSFQIFFDYKFEMKDNKFRLTIDNIFKIISYKKYNGERYIDTGNVQKTYISGTREGKFEFGILHISRMITQKGIINELTNYINGINAGSEW